MVTHSSKIEFTANTFRPGRYALITTIGICAVLSGCNPLGPSREVVMLSEAIKFTAICGVIISAISGVTLVLRELIRLSNKNN
jgi:hypothetical protein